MSANLIVDLGGTVAGGLTIGTTNTSGGVAAFSGAVIGNTVDLLHEHVATQVSIAGCALIASGQLRIQIQTADTDVSGNYTDPTSGLAQLPSWMSSGGIFILNSGQTGAPVAGQLGTRGAFTSGQALLSGFQEFGYFQRPDRNGRFARANVLSGDAFFGTLTVSLFGNLHLTGSGGGFSLLPSSGGVNV